MSTEVMNRQASVPADLQEKVLLGGDLARLTPAERLSYYNAVCTSMRLNPLTRPFEYLALNGRLVLYARKDCTDQLRDRYDVSIERLDREVVEGIYVVTAHAKNLVGRTDESIGAVPMPTSAADKANAMMKAETKAKRRVTLSICGLGMLDETEIETIHGAHPIPQQPAHGEQDGDRQAAEIGSLARPDSTQQATDAAPPSIFDTSSAIADHETALKEAAERGNEALNKAWDDCKADKRLTSEDRHPLFQLMQRLAKGMKRK